jgi:DNA-binding transcriptional regulator LsrR (DeoR family)
MMFKDLLTTEQFVHAYLRAHKQGKNQNQLAYDIGISRQAVNNRVKRLLDAGVKLPLLIRTDLMPRIDVAKMNEIIDSEIGDQTT